MLLSKFFKTPLLGMEMCSLRLSEFTGLNFGSLLANSFGSQSASKQERVQRMLLSRPLIPSGPQRYSWRSLKNNTSPSQTQKKTRISKEGSILKKEAAKGKTLRNRTNQVGKSTTLQKTREVKQARVQKDQNSAELTDVHQNATSEMDFPIEPQEVENVLEVDGKVEHPVDIHITEQTTQNVEENKEADEENDGEDGEETDDENGEESSEEEKKRITNFELPSFPRVKIKSAVFIKSSANVDQCPKDGRPEFAVIGRSNVGKSSLINMLVGRSNLAQTSKKPGKTQLINHYLINDEWYLVDLPGYGFAKAPVAIRTEWNEFTKDFFLKRKTLVSVCLLVDASIPPQQIDIECADWLARNEVPTTIVFTKCDRKKKKKNGGKNPHENVKDFEASLGEVYDECPPWIMTSSAKQLGKDELLGYLTYLRKYWNS